MGVWSVTTLWLCVMLCCCSLAVGAGDDSDVVTPYTPKEAYTEYDFPNPSISRDLEKCGVDTFSFVCDPAHSLSKPEVEELNKLIYSLRESETCLCTHSSNCRKLDKHRIMIAVVPRIKLEFGGFPTSRENQIGAARQFAEHLRDSAWETVAWCAMHAFIVYDVHTKRIWTATDKYAFKVISNERAKETGLNAQEDYLNKGMIFEGLKDMVTKYKEFLDAGVPPPFNWWQILLIVLAVLVGIGLCVLFIFCVVRNCDGGSGSGGYTSTHHSEGGFWSSGGGGGGGGGSECGGGGGG